MKYKLFNTLFVAAGISYMNIISGCVSSHRDDVTRIMVSIPPQQDLVKAIGGDRIEVGCVMTSDANPESFEPAMNTLLDIQRSDIYFKMGTLDFEKKLSENDKTQMVNMSEGVDLIYGTHGECGHHHHEGEHHHLHAADPHVWGSLRNMKVMALNVADALIEADPDGADYYKKNLDALCHEIDSLDNLVTSELDSVKSRSFIVWHPSLSYFARDYGLNQITVGMHGKELSVAQLAGRIDSARVSEAGVFFFQQEFDSKQAREINSQLGAEIVIINPMNPDWRSEIMKVARALYEK